MTPRGGYEEEGGGERTHKKRLQTEEEKGLQTEERTSDRERSSDRGGERTHKKGEKTSDRGGEERTQKKLQESSQKGRTWHERGPKEALRGRTGAPTRPQESPKKTRRRSEQASQGLQGGSGTRKRRKKKHIEHIMFFNDFAVRHLPGRTPSSEYGTPDGLLEGSEVLPGPVGNLPLTPRVHVLEGPESSHFAGAIPPQTVR